MKLIENMTLLELGAERKIQLRRIDSAKSALEKIHGTKDYSDEMAKHFHLGKVGFRKDTKRQNRTLENAIDNGVKACEHYETIEESKSAIHTIDRAVNFIAENKNDGETVKQITQNQKNAALESAIALKWEKVSGHYGAAYKCGNIIIERVNAGFVAVRDIKGNLLTHCKTIKEAKATVSIATERHRKNE